MDKYYLYGSGRDASTRTLRKINPGKNHRQVRLGNTVIRPGRRIQVSAEFVDTYHDEIARQVAAGYIIVETKPGVRHTLPAKGEGVLADVLGSLDTDEDSGDPEDGDDTEGDGGDETTENDTENDEPPPADPVPEMPATPAEPPVDETAVDDDSDEELIEESLEEPVGDLAEEEDFAEEELQDEPALEDEGDDVPEDRATKTPLPEGWESFVKKDLLGLMASYGITVPEKTTNEALINAIREWRDA